MDIEDQIDEILNGCVGEANAIQWMQLHQIIQDELDQTGGGFIDPGELRNTIKEMRRKGALIASSPRGYFRPATLKEALQYINRQFRQPAKDELLTARIQRQTAINYFGGQYSLFEDPKIKYKNIEQSF